MGRNRLAEFSRKHFHGRVCAMGRSSGKLDFLAGNWETTVDMERLDPVSRGTKYRATRFGRATLGVLLGAVSIPAIAFAVAGAGQVALLGSALGWMLLWLAAVDARRLCLPDRITLPLIVAGLFSGLILHPAHFWDHAVGAAAGFMIFRLVEGAFRMVRGHDGLGRGDAKLLAAGGAWVAWYGLPSVILIASLAGIIQALFSGRFRSRKAYKAPLPFGPALALGIWLVWLFGPLEWRGIW